MKLNGALTRTLTEGTAREKKAREPDVESMPIRVRTVVYVVDLIGQGPHAACQENPIKRGQWFSHPLQGTSKSDIEMRVPNHGELRPVPCHNPRATIIAAIK